MDKRIFLLTGATGLLGGSISAALISSGENVRALVRDPAGARLHKDVEISRGDILDIPSLEKFFKAPENSDIYVIHCAGMIDLDPGYNQMVHDVNITGTRNMIRLCLEHDIKKLVYISSTGAIPELPSGRPIAEVDSFDPDAVIGYYSKSKAIATSLVLEAVSEYGLDASILFPSGIIGPYDHRFGLFAGTIAKIVKGRIPCGFDGKFNCVDVRDLAGCAISCCEKGKKGEGYIISGQVVTMRDLFDAVASESGCRRIHLILPAFISRLLAVMVGSVSRLIHRPTILTSFTVYNLLRNNDFNNEKAIKEFDCHFRPFSETIHDEVLWLREEGMI